MDQLDDGADLARLVGQHIDLAGGLGGILGQPVQVGGDFGGRLTARPGDFSRLDGLLLFLFQQVGHVAQTGLRTTQRFAEQGQVADDLAQGVALRFLLALRHRL